MRIGTRGSPLALAQAEMVRARLPGGPAAHPLVVIRTTGDLKPDTALTRLGGKGVFTKEIEEALLRKEIDLAVHSLKDLPTGARPGLALAALLEREDPRDAWIARGGARLDALPAGARVGTSSSRRRAQVLARRPDLLVEDLRGNVTTRLQRLDEGRFDAIVVAAAGLKRLNLIARATELLDEAVMLPAPGQGVLAVQTRDGDAAVEEAVKDLHDPVSAAEAAAERALLEALGGGCLLPVAARARLEFGTLEIEGFVGHPSGRPSLRRAASGCCGASLSPEDLGRRLAGDLLAAGAREILDSLPKET